MQETERPWCARCSKHRAMKGSAYCRIHGDAASKFRERTTSDMEEPEVCTYQPLPGEILKSACPDCGHAAVLHIGVEHCPVCELVQHNQQAREASVTFEQVVSGEKSTSDYRAARSLPSYSDATVTVHVEGRVLDETTLRDVVEKQVRRYGQGRA